MLIYPLLLKPPIKDYLWGGTRLKTEYNYETDKEKAAEAWVLSCHKDGSDIVENGELAGKTLPEVLELWGDKAIGKNAAAFPYFPLLIKLIDAKDRLSVQVHPDDTYALKNEGELGKLKRSVWIITNWYRTQSYYDSGEWRATWRGEGGGVLLNQAPHNLDIWQWICGMPSAVTAFCNAGKFHNIEVEDEATIYAEYKNGATGVFITSTGDCPGTNRLEITGTRGKLVLENGILKLWKLNEDERDICKNATEGFVSPETEYSEFSAEREEAHAGILKNFAGAILHGEELLSPGYDGINELMISNAAYLSQWTGNSRIPLPFDTAEFDRLLKEKQKSSEIKEKTVKKSTDKSCGERWQINW